MTISDLDDVMIKQFRVDVGDAAGELAQLFVNETRDRVARMLDATDNTDDAHSLKGAAATYGLCGLAETAKQLMDACRNDDDVRAAELLADIEAGVEVALEGFLKKLED